MVDIIKLGKLIATMTGANVELNIGRDGSWSLNSYGNPTIDLDGCGIEEFVAKLDKRMQEEGDFIDTMLRIISDGKQGVNAND